MQVDQFRKDNKYLKSHSKTKEEIFFKNLHKLIAHLPIHHKKHLYFHNPV